MKFTKATVLLTSGPDKVILETGLPCPFVKEFMPSQQPLSFTFDATYDTGAEYVKDNFDIKPEIINTRPNQHVWKMYDTGIGYGGYKECTVCGLNTYSDRCSKCNKKTPLTDVCLGKKVCKCVHVPYRSKTS